MANELNIGVKFGAEGMPQVTKSISDLQAQLKRFQAGLNNATGVDSIARLNRAIDQTKERIKNLQQFTGTAGAALSGKFSQGANQATNSMVNLSRIVQDAPFGFIGIANNINPLLESFQRLKAETGSTGGAIKALGGSLLGAGGIGLAVSALTSAITLFSMGTFGATKQLQGFDKALQDANNEAGKEIANLKVLAALAANTNVSIKERKEATEQLQKALKENNVQLSQEEILNNNAAEAIKTATAAILARAKARAVESRVAELAAKDLDRELKREDILKRLKKAQAAFNADLEREKKLLEGTGETARGDIELETEIRGLNQVLSELSTEASKATDEMNLLLSKVTESPDKKTDGKDPVVDFLKRRVDALKSLQSTAGLSTQQKIELTGLEIQLAQRDAVKLGFTKKELQDQIKAILENAFPIDTFEFNITPSLKITTPQNAKRPAENLAELLGLDKITDTDIEKATEPIRKAAVKSAESLKKAVSDAAVQSLSESLQKTLDEIQTGAIASLGESLGDLFVGAAKGQDLFQSLFTVIAEGAEQLGKAMVAYGVALVGFKLALKSLNPFVAIAAGAGLIIAGKALKNAIPKFADGVQNFSGGLAIVGERGPELVNLPKGSDVIPNHMLGGGNMNVILSPVVEFGYDRLRIGLQREDARRKRI